MKKTVTQWTLLLIHLILPPFHWRMSNLKGLREPGYGHGLPSAPWRQHIAQLQEASFPGRHQSGSPPSPDCVTGLGGATKAPPFTCSLCAQNGANVQTSARSVCLLFKKFGTTSYCLGLVLFPATRFVTGSLLKIPFNSDVLLTQ